MASTGMSANTERVRILDQFIRTLDKDEADVVVMYLAGFAYPGISEFTFFDETELRMQVSRLKKQFSEYAGMDLDLEQLRTEWQDQHRDGQRSENRSDQILTDAWKRYEERRRQYRFSHYADIAMMFMVAAVVAADFHEMHAATARVFVLVVMPALFFEFLLRLQRRAEEFNERFHGPDRMFLGEQGARILRRIRQTKWQVAWYAVTGIGGAIYLVLPTTHGHGGGRIIGFLSAWLCVHVFVLIQRLIRLRPWRISVDLKKYDSVLCKSHR